MATILDDEDTIEAQALSTSLDPYGQLLKMLMPRALCIAIHDRGGMPIWMSDGCDSADLLQLVEEGLNSARIGALDAAERDGFSRSWNGDTAYVFLLRDGTDLLGAVALSCQDPNNGARPFSLVLGLLRPALQVLNRELVNQYNIGDLQKNLTLRDGDLDLLIEASGGADNSQADDFNQLLRNCVTHLGCAFGALMIPAKKIAIAHSVDKSRQRADADALERVQRHLYAWAQVQRRTLTMNKPAPANSPFGSLPIKILACPIRQTPNEVAGILMLFRPMSAPDFDVRQVRIVEMMTRRIGYLLQNAYDLTTGLLTRSAFEQRAFAALSSGVGKAEHCVAYADVDRLHVVNENHGMHAGDEVIARIADGIRTNLPVAITASRISGDRFALFLPDTSLEAAEDFLGRLCTTIATLEHAHESKKIELSLSIGVARVPDTKYPLSHALAAAEVACKAAKDRGRGRVEAYHDADRSIVRRYEDVAIAGDLRDAIANDRFRMEAQPIVQLAGSGPPRRFELLLRMIDASGNSVAPDKFFSAAERYQLATDIDRWVVQYALEILSSAASALQSLGAHFAINLSGQSVGDEDFPAFLEAKLREYNLPPSLLSFEITETSAVANIVRAETLVRRLQDLGHDIALDDFGRGLSSLTYLKSLSVSDLKIDGGLVRDVATNSRSQAMVTAIVQLAKTMKLRTTAECVESEAIQAAVARLGVDFGQGFAIGRPRPLEIVLQEILRGAPGMPRVSGSPLMSRLAG
ncbi:MAG TPA: bifunctional diguanylate cyclase/phosphodiesterase [Steroidobacteraceae bacterium]|nr:bifunctional diguanylate cyclase/phosphodiesterase [Steroidobacteraceae bacterium]